MNTRSDQIWLSRHLKDHPMCVPEQEDTDVGPRDAVSPVGPSSRETALG